MEALIAVALLAAAFLPILELQSRFVRTTESLERASSRIADRQLATEWVAATNFAYQQTGTAQLGGRLLEWRATLVEPPRPMRMDYGIPSRFEMSLHDVELIIRHTTSPEIISESLTLRGIGWRPTESIFEGL